MEARTRIGRWVESPPVQHAIVTLILLNAATLGLETSTAAMAAFGDILHALDQAILTVFVAEIALKVYARDVHFFREPWKVTSTRP